MKRLLKKDIIQLAILALARQPMGIINHFEIIIDEYKVDDDTVVIVELYSQIKGKKSYRVFFNPSHGIGVQIMNKKDYSCNYHFKFD
jgi:hypothetical protein